MMTRTDGGAMTNGHGVPPIKETIGTQGWRARRAVGRSFSSALMLSAACGAALLVASRVRTGSPWLGLNSLATVSGLGPRKTRKRFDMSATIAGAGVLAAGILVLAGLYQGTLVATGKR